MSREAKIKKLEDQLREFDDKGHGGLLAAPEDAQQRLQQRELLTGALLAEKEALRLEAESSRQKGYAESMANAAIAVSQQKEDQENRLISLNHLVGELVKIGSLNSGTGDYKARSDEAREQILDAISSKQLTPRKRGTLFPIKSLPISWPADAVVNDNEVIEWLLKIGATLPSRFNKASNTGAALPSKDKAPELRKSNALVTEFSKIWPSIERDIKDKTRHANGQLNQANVSHGYYDVEKALTWAKTEGKITKDKAESYVGSSNDSILTALIGQIFNLN